jgi:nitrite reductase/ring-hydroxylating ferredoxin subunit
MKHELCKIAAIPTAGSRIVPFFGRELHIYGSGDEIRAVANVCLHFGGPLDCQDGKFVCLWHNASFDMATGERVNGPASKGSRLMFLSTRVEGNALYYVWGD